MNEILAAVLGYFFGSIPFGLLLVKAAGLGDVRSIGSGNIGATNVLRTGNKAVDPYVRIEDDKGKVLMEEEFGDGKVSPT